MEEQEKQRSRPLRTLPTCLLGIPILGGVACGGPPPVLPAPTVDVERAVATALEQNGLPRTVRAVFRWNLREPNLRAAGRGVARVEPPDRARLDLFLDDGQSLLAAALVADTLHAPEGAPTQIVPPPPLLWASLGVLRPPEGATLVGGAERGERLRLRYGLATGDELRYELDRGQLAGADLYRDGSALHEVDLDRDAAWELPREATYRNLAAFRELRVVVESVVGVESYPADIFYPIGGR